MVLINAHLHGVLIFSVSRHLVEMEEIAPVNSFKLNKKQGQIRKSCTSLLYTEIDLWNTCSMLIFHIAKHML